MKNFFSRLPTVVEPQTPVTVVEDLAQPRMSARMLERYIEATQANLEQLTERAVSLQDEIRFLIQEHAETKVVIEAQGLALSRLRADRKTPVMPAADTSTLESE